MKLASLAAFVVALFFTSAALASEGRFSNSLNAEQKSASGLKRLSSDQVAILDALVRRDTATRGQTPAPKSQAEAAPAEFSQRLSADERRNTGFTTLSPEEAAKLDALIDTYQNALLARTFLSPPQFLTPSRRVATTERKPERNVHGSFSLSYGWGSGGYSEKTGSMVVTIDDPARNLSISIGYSQSHIKGGHGYIYRDPYYDPLRRGPDLPDPVQP